MNVFCPSPATSVWQEACDTSHHTVNRRCATSPRNSPALPPSFLSRSHHFPSIGHTNSARHNRGACRSTFRYGEQSSSLLLSAFPKSRGRHRGISPNLDIAAAANSGIRHRFYGLSCLGSCHGFLAAIPNVIFFDDTTRDLGVMFLALLLALAWVRLFDELARNHLLEQKLSRKLVHISSGLLLMLSWPLFSSAPAARAFAAVVPALNLVRLLALGMGWAEDEATVRAISRGGQRSELLRGPLYYVVALTAITLAFWSTSPVGAIALALMCGGDGVADIVGRRVGSAKLPWNPHKSWAGSAAMLGCGYVLAMGFTSYFDAFGSHIEPWTDVGVKVAFIALVSTIVESLPITDKLDDNLTVPLSAVIVGSLLFPLGPL